MSIKQLGRLGAGFPSDVPQTGLFHEEEFVCAGICKALGTGTRSAIHGGVATWPDGRFEYRYFGGHHLLQLCLGKLSERDITAFLQGQVHVGFYLRQAVLFVLFKIEHLMEILHQAYLAVL